MMRSLKRSFTTYHVMFLIIMTALLNLPSKASEVDLTDDDLRLMKVCEGVVRLFGQRAGAIWPGYSLAEQPFLVYSPERWALLINSNEPLDGFGDLPGEWPNLGLDASYRQGRYEDLIGQLKFNMDLTGENMVAIGFRESILSKHEQPEFMAFSYIVHEAFHQYQYNVFGEIPWAREEKYPISDFVNGSLAWLEMCILEDALEAIKADDWTECRSKVEMFIAVRRYRWEMGNPFFREYEQGKELSEGTAKYVELKCVELFPSITYVSSIDGTISQLARQFPNASMPKLLLQELREKMVGDCLQPEDIPRNRIYAVAAIQAFLLDYFGIEWQVLAQEAGPGFTYVGLLDTHLGVDESQLTEIVVAAKLEYDYEAILAATTKKAVEYQLAYQREVEAFEAQAGTRVEVVVSSSGLSRSRISREKKWLADDGLFLFCKNFDIYTLKGGKFSFELHDAGLLEINEWDAKMKTLVLYDGGVDSVAIDDQPANTLVSGTCKFDSVELKGDVFILRSQHPGKLITEDKKVRVLLYSN